MACLHCGAKIGFLRLLKDKEFCSDEHRRKNHARSARAAREARWNYGDEELYDVYEILEQPADQEKKAQMQKVQASAAMVLSIVLVFVLAFSWMGGGTSNAPLEKRDILGLASKAGNTVALPSNSGGFLASLKSSITMKAPLRLKDDFQTGFDSWIGTPFGGAADAGWRIKDGAVLPGRLRLWEPSVSLSDYKMEFEGQIQRNALSWTYRSTNLQNFYASKIVVKTTGRAPSLEIVRYAMVEGREQVRTKLPIPMMSIPKSLYHVQMQVRGDQFTTVLNGQVVDTWTNAELKRGGVGFFSDPGEQAAINWVNVNEERGGLLSQILSLGFFSAPILH